MAMPTRISESFDYPAPAERVFAMICTTDFQRAKCQAANALSEQVGVELGNGRVVLECNRRLSTQNLSLPAGINLGPAVEVRETQDWAQQPSADGRYHGSITVWLAGIPLSFNGTLAMGPGGSGTLEQVEGELRSTIPLLGGTIERAAEPAIRAGISIEQQVGRQQLADPA